MLKHLLQKLLSRVATASDLREARSQIAAQRLLAEDTLILQAQILSAMNARLPATTPLAEVEFRAFSQYGEDGILQFLITHTQISAAEKIFVEFGVESYREANTRLLLLKDYWRGLVIDGSAANIELIRADRLYWRHQLDAQCAWIGRENINELILGAGIKGRIGVLSIDVDGNDYWILEAIDSVDPVILVVEWNSVFGDRAALSVPYQHDFDRRKAHFSQQYWGASVAAFELLAARKGYSLVGSNRAGNNLFFVRSDRLGGLPVRSAQAAFVDACFRDSRDASGALTFLEGAQRAAVIADLPLVDVSSGAMTSLGAQLRLPAPAAGNPKSS